MNAVPAEGQHRSSCRVQRTSDPCILIRTSASRMIDDASLGALSTMSTPHYYCEPLWDHHSAYGRLGKLGPRCTALERLRVPTNSPRFRINSLLLGGPASRSSQESNSSLKHTGDTLHSTILLVLGIGTIGWKFMWWNVVFVLWAI